jgi:hypothetical protein
LAKMSIRRATDCRYHVDSSCGTTHERGCWHTWPASLTNAQLLQCEYLIAENRILRSHLPQKLRLSDPERRTLAEIGKRLGRKLLETWPVSPNPRPSWPGIVA